MVNLPLKLKIANLSQEVGNALCLCSSNSYQILYYESPYQLSLSLCVRDCQRAREDCGCFLSGAPDQNFPGNSCHKDGKFVLNRTKISILASWHRDMQTCCEPWIDSARNIVPSFCARFSVKNIVTTLLSSSEHLHVHCLRIWQLFWQNGVGQC